MPCAVNSPGFEELPFDVFGHECPVDAEKISRAQTEGFAWIGTVRDPIEQAASWYMHARRGHIGYRNITSWLEGCNDQHPCGFYTFKPNLQTRWLAGHACYKTPSLSCVEAALDNLARMDVVLEQRASTLAGLDRLAVLGWQVPVPAPDAQGYTSNAAAYIAGMSKEERRHLEALQVYDIKLIAGARKR